ncbi:protein ZNRD2-like [Saccostrea echinata]|uniref:protein ZNRD2-like n=1 Tax=Saccostrea echinata TaxID=191078 RepID=UPI002A82546F|nr:protein ZNRD2-like [Saccostrea echinata]
MKILEARRERSDRISKLMGDYLLKGYKMLGNVCEVCDTILLEDKQAQKYCIACRELDTDTCKDDPVVSSTAARSLTEERQGMTQTIGLASQSSVRNPTVQGQQHILPHTTDSRLDLYETGAQNLQKLSGGSQSVGAHHISACNSAVDSLCDKIKWASEELKHSSGVEYSIQLCNLIKASADALQSLKSLN